MHAYKSSVFPYIPKFARVRDARAQELLILIARARVRASPQKRNTYTRAHVRTYTCIRFNESTRLTMPFSTHTHTHTHAHTHASPCAHTCMHTCTHACSSCTCVRDVLPNCTRTCTHVRSFAANRIHIHMPAKHACMRTCTLLPIYTYINIYIYI